MRVPRKRMVRAAILGACVLLCSVALATDGGLFAEQVTSADGASVRRIRDTTNGVVCYLASNREGYSVNGGRVAISCVALPQH